MYCPTCPNEKRFHLSTNKFPVFTNVKSAKLALTSWNFFKDQKPTFMLFLAHSGMRAHSDKCLGFCYMIRTNFMCAWSRDWTILPPSRKTLSTFHFELCRNSRGCLLHCNRFWACRYTFCYGIASWFWWESSGVLILSPCNVQTNKTSNLVYKRIARNCVERWMFGIQWIPNNVLRDVKGEIFAKGTKMPDF